MGEYRTWLKSPGGSDHPMKVRELPAASRQPLMGLDFSSKLKGHV